MSKTNHAAAPEQALDASAAEVPPMTVAVLTAANDGAGPAAPDPKKRRVGGRDAARPANDDHVSILALGTAIARVSNDNDADSPEPPLPGAYAVVPPSSWPADHEHVVRVIAEALRVVADPASDANERRVALKLLDVGQRDGRLPSYAGRPAIMAFRHRFGLPSSAMAAGQKSRALFDRLAPHFLLEEVDSTAETRSGSFFRAARNNVVSKMRGYVARCAEGNIEVPANGRGGFHVEGVAQAIGERSSRLRWNVPARRLLREALAKGDVKLGKVFVPAPGLPEGEHRERVAAMKSFWDGFDVPGGKVPESPLRRGYIDWEHAAALSGETEVTVLEDPAVRKHAMNIATRRGVMLPGLMTRLDNLAALRVWGLEQIANESRDKPTSSAIISNYKAVFDRMVREAEMVLEDEATPLFVAETYEAVLDRALAGFDNPRTAANFRRAALRWLLLHSARVGAAELPASLPDAIDALLGIRGVTQSAVAERLGVKAGAIREIILGSQSLSHRNLKLVVSMERLFELAPGTLTSKVGLTPPRPTLSATTPEYRVLSRRLRRLLPTEATGWSGERLEAAVAQVAPLLSGSTSYGRLLKAAALRGEYLPAFQPNERLSRDLNAFRIYKEAPVSYPMARARGARWKSGLSGDVGMKELALPFRYAVGPVDGGTAAGLGIDPRLQTMAWLAHAPFALGLFAQRSMRNADVPDGKGGTRGRVYTVSERHLAAQLLSMTNPLTGWLTQRPDLAHELVALKARVPSGHDDLLSHFGTGDGTLVLSAEDVALAQRDWPAFVGRAHGIYSQVVDHLDTVLEITRNPFQGIRGIVENAEPQAVLLRAIFDSERHWADERTSPLLHRLDVRNSVMLRLAAITAFRPANIIGLTFRIDGMGKIRKVDGRWEIFIDRREFKNFRNSRLFGTSTSPTDYHKVLRDEAGLYDLLDRYFFVILPELRTGLEGDAGFVAKLGKPMSAHCWYDVVRNFGRRHLAHNPVRGTGIAGVTSFNPYSFRHVRASDVLLNGTSVNRVEEAAFALQTSEAMISRHYGFLLPNAATASGSETFGRATRLAWKK